jgi:hypothetical protein
MTLRRSWTELFASFSIRWTLLHCGASSVTRATASRITTAMRNEPETAGVPISAAIRALEHDNPAGEGERLAADAYWIEAEWPRVLKT